MATPLGIDGIDDAVAIGSGGNAIVYKARETSHDRWVAVKVLRSADDASRRRFNRERRAMGRLSGHDGIATIHSSGLTDNGDPYLVMALYEHGSLQDRLERRGAIDWREAGEIMAAVADAVHYGHERNVIHRDLKPSNILIADSGRPLVADFGISRFSGSSASAGSAALTFTPAYSPPEVIEGSEPSVRGDVYGLGATLFALINGQAPFTSSDSESIFTVIRRISTDPIGDLRGRGVAPSVCELIEEATAKDASDRPATAREFAAALAGALESVEASTAAPPVRELEQADDSGRTRVVDPGRVPPPVSAGPPPAGEARAPPVSAGPPATGVVPAPAASAKPTPAVPGPPDPAPEWSRPVPPPPIPPPPPARHGEIETALQPHDRFIGETGEQVEERDASERPWLALGVIAVCVAALGLLSVGVDDARIPIHFPAGDVALVVPIAGAIAWVVGVRRARGFVAGACLGFGALTLRSLLNVEPWNAIFTGGRRDLGATEYLVTAGAGALVGAVGVVAARNSHRESPSRSHVLAGALAASAVVASGFVVEDSPPALALHSMRPERLLFDAAGRYYAAIAALVLVPLLVVALLALKRVPGPRWEMAIGAIATLCVYMNTGLLHDPAVTLGSPLVFGPAALLIVGMAGALYSTRPVATDEIAAAVALFGFGAVLLVAEVLVDDHGREQLGGGQISLALALVAVAAAFVGVVARQAASGLTLGVCLAQLAFLPALLTSAEERGTLWWWLVLGLGLLLLPVAMRLLQQLGVETPRFGPQAAVALAALAAVSVVSLFEAHRAEHWHLRGDGCVDQRFCGSNEDLAIPVAAAHILVLVVAALALLALRKGGPSVAFGATVAVVTVRVGHAHSFPGTINSELIDVPVAVATATAYLVFWAILLRMRWAGDPVRAGGKA